MWDPLPVLISLRDFFLKGPGIEPSIDPRGTSPSLQAPSHVAKTLRQLEVNLNDIHLDNSRRLTAQRPADSIPWFTEIKPSVGIPDLPRAQDIP